MTEPLSIEQRAQHCKDCCCARSWTALGFEKYTGLSIPEHIEMLRNSLREYMAFYPAFRAKPIGAPTSEARERQDSEIALENRAKIALGERP